MLMMCSFLEYGCFINGWDFGEVVVLMSDKMMSVYFGGLMYEYVMGDNGYGIVKIFSVKGFLVQKLDGFEKFVFVLVVNLFFEGDGGFVLMIYVNVCFIKDVNWFIDMILLLVIFEQVKMLMMEGVGFGFGFGGDGFQNVVDVGISSGDVE